MEKIKSLPANYIFQAVDSRQIGMMERFYRASDVDALLSDVRRLVEAAKLVLNAMRCYEMDVDEYPPHKHKKMMKDYSKAIAAVERHFVSEGGEAY